jgi:hypothetical protein
MPRRDFPEWQRLADALGELARDCGSLGAYVLDSQANLWCAGDDLYDGGDSDMIMDLVHERLGALPLPLNRGGHIDAAFRSAYLRSFAGIYIVALRFAGPFDVDLTQRAIAASLPRIEALTLLLPPPDGPGSSGASGFGVA